MDIGGEFTTIVIDIDGNEHEVNVQYKGYFFPAKLNGSPENSYPAEGELTELEVDLPAGIEFDDLEDYLHNKAWEHFQNGRF